MSLFFDDEPQPPEQSPAATPASDPFASCDASATGESTPLEPIDTECFPFDKLSTPVQDTGDDAVTFNVPQTVTRGTHPLAETFVESPPDPLATSQQHAVEASVAVPNHNGEVDDDPAREFFERERDAFSSFNDELSVESLAGTNGPLMVSSGVESGSSFEMASPVTAARVVPEAVIAAEVKIRERIELKDAEEAKQVAELREQARRELEEFHAKYREQLRKTKATNREAQEAFVEERDRVAGDGKKWEKVGSLCDLSGKGCRGAKDVTRMRTILMQLKQKPVAVKGHHC